MGTFDAASPFAEFKKLLERFKLPGFDVLAVMEARCKEVEALKAANQAAFKGMQALEQKQAEMLHSALAELQHLAKKQAAGDIPSVQTAELVQQTLHKALADMQQLAQAAYSTQADSYALIAKQVEENVCTLKSVLETARTVDDPEQAAINFRDELLKLKWRDGKGVAALLGMAIDVANPNQCAYRLRKNSVLFGVWNGKDRCYLYPDFQFNKGTLRPQVEELLKVLPRGEDDKGGWRGAFWLYSPHALLDGEKPADVFTTDPRRVIDVATQEFREHQDAGW